jgi:S-formylglutathione hydrolase FrmB
VPEQAAGSQATEACRGAVSMDRVHGRYLRPLIAGPSLEGNPLGSPAERELHVYLPPGYHQDSGRRYPVLYFLHGYGSAPPTVPSRAQLAAAFPRPLRPLGRAVARRAVALATLENLDALIVAGTLPPFILVQPDGSLHRAQRYGARGLDGKTTQKGSFYADCPRTGRYAEYVFGDVVAYVDRTYRTLARREGRALLGASMGGYGALLGGILRPERFAAVAALSPVIASLDLLGLRLVRPYQRLLRGPAGAAARGARDVEDVLETCDWVFGGDRETWSSADLSELVARTPGALRGVEVQVSCAETDEFGLAGPCRRFARALAGLGLSCELEIYEARGLARLSPHILGIAGRILPAIRFCLRHLGDSRLWPRDSRLRPRL